jgi:hypothetical protein
MAIPDYMVDTRTHKRWWTCVPAWPLSKEERYYKILKHVFSDHTTNTFGKKSQLWSGFYTEGEERHQVVGVFQNFSIFSSINWVERLLKACCIDYTKPIRSVSWQYELRGCDLKTAKQLHADIALRIKDASEQDGEMAVIFEAKKYDEKNKGPGKQDINDPKRYLRLNHLDTFKRKHSRFLIDRGNEDKWKKSGFKPETDFITWDKINEIQQLELTEISDDVALVDYFLSACEAQFQWYRDRQPYDSPDHSLDVGQLSSLPRLKAFLFGLRAVALARSKQEPSVPPNEALYWITQEPTVEDYRNAKNKQDWNAVVWGV